ncbi:MAG: murein hydrolase activator EnvC family protein [Halothiobacillus sp.]
MTAFFRFGFLYPARSRRAVLNLGLICLLGLLFWAEGISGAKAADNPQQLKSAIEQQKLELEKTRAAQEKTRQSLKKTQQQLAESARAQEALEDQVAALEAAQSKLKAEANLLEQSIQALKPQIADSVKLAYTLGDQASLGSLFAYNDALTTERNLRYIKILLAQSMDKMAQLDQATRQQAHNQQSLLDAQAKLNKAQNELQKNTAKRRAQQAEQNQLLASLSSRADEQSQHLATLLEQKKTLDAQIASLNAQAARERAERKTQAQAEAQAKADAAHARNQQAKPERASRSPTPEPAEAESTPDEEASPPTAAARSGALPVVGKIIRSYGAPIAGGDMQSQGILFAAPFNSPVRAVAAGKVVFADAMKGWGNLIIVRHPGGYMSLYAHNSRLLVQTGARVNQGTELALSGQIDGHEAGLYFEVRHGNDTVNPARWAAYRAVSR